MVTNYGGGGGGVLQNGRSGQVKFHTYEKGGQIIVSHAEGEGGRKSYSYSMEACTFSHIEGGCKHFHPLKGELHYLNCT